MASVKVNWRAGCIHIGLGRTVEKGPMEICSPADARAIIRERGGLCEYKAQDFVDAGLVSAEEASLAGHTVRDPKTGTDIPASKPPPKNQGPDFSLMSNIELQDWADAHNVVLTRRSSHEQKVAACQAAYVALETKE